MEIINNNTDQSKDITSSRNIYLGVILALSGIIWMSYNLHLISSKCFSNFFSWQMLIVAIGGYFLTLRKWALGTATILIGATFAISDWFNLCLPVKDIILPAILIASGIIIIVQHIRK